MKLIDLFLKEKPEIKDSIKGSCSYHEMENLLRIKDHDEEEMVKIIEYFYLNYSQKLYELFFENLEKSLNSGLNCDNMTLISAIYISFYISDHCENLCRDKFTDSVIFDSLKLYPSDMRIMTLYFTYLKSHRSQLTFSDVFNVVVKNIIDKDNNVRLAALKILSCVQNQVHRIFFETLLEIQAIPNDFVSYREKIMKLKQMIFSLTPNEYLLQSYVYFLISHYMADLSLIHDSLNDLILEFYKDPAFNSFLNKIFTTLLKRSLIIVSLVYYQSASLLSENIIASLRMINSSQSYLNHDSIVAKNKNDTHAHCASTARLFPKHLPAISNNLSIDEIHNLIDKNSSKSSLTMHRKVLIISLQFKSIINDNSTYIFNHLKILIENIPNSLSISIVKMDYLINDEVDSNLYLWKEMFNFCCKALESLKNIQKASYSSELIGILLKFIPVSIFEISRPSLSLYAKISQKPINFDFFNAFYEMGSVSINDKMTNYFARNSETHPILIRIIISVICAKKTSDSSIKIFKSLLDSSNFCHEIFLSSFFDYIFDLFSYDFKQSFRILAPKTVLKIFTIILELIEAAPFKISAFYSRLFPIIFHIFRSYILIENSDSKFKYKIISKNYYKTILCVICRILRTGFDPSNFLNEFHDLFFDVIKSHQNNDLSSSYFIELCFGLINTSSHEFLLGSVPGFPPFTALMVLCLKENISKPKRNMIFKIFTILLTKYPFKIDCHSLFESLPFLCEDIEINPPDYSEIGDCIDLISNVINFAQSQSSAGIFEKILQVITKINIPTKNENLYRMHQERLIIIFETLMNSTENINPEILKFISNWFFNINYDSLRVKILQILMNKSIIDKEIYKFLEELNSLQEFGSNFGPDISIRCNALRNLGSEFLSIYLENPFILKLVFSSCFKCFKTCIEDFLIPIAFMTFLNKFLPLVSNAHDFTSDYACLLIEECAVLLRAKIESKFQAGLSLLSCLINNNISQNFKFLTFLNNCIIENLIHVQIIHKIYGVINLRSAVKEMDIPGNIVEKFVLPISLFFVSHEKSADHAYHNLTKEAILLIGEISKKISWTKYKSLLNIFSRNTNFLYDEGLKEQKKRIKILCTLLDNFPFKISDAGNNCVNRKDLQDLVQNLVNNIHTRMACKENRDMMPAFTDIKETTIKAPLFLVVIHLLKILDDDTMDLHVKGIISLMVEMAGNNIHDMRICGRSLLIKTVKILGPKYLKLILENLQSSLKDGYKKHIYIENLNRIMISINEEYSEAVNSCLKIIINAIILDQFGIVAEERQVDAIRSKTREARKGKGQNLSEILGKFIFSSNIETYLTSFMKLNTKMNCSNALKIYEKCLNRFFSGFQNNSNITTESMLHLSEICILKYMPQKEKSEILSSTAIKIIPSRLLPPDPRKTEFKNSALRLELNHLIVCFGLKVFYFVLKNKIKPDMAIDISPHISNILSCIESPFLKIVAKSFYCLKFILKTNSQLVEKTEALFQIVYAYLKELIDSGSDFEDTLCGFQVLVLILKQSHFVIDETIAKSLIMFCENNLVSTKNSACFALLKIIISKKLEIPAIIEVMNTVRNICLYTQDEKTKKSCHYLIIQFLSNFKRGHIGKCLEFFLANLKYDEKSGVISSVEVLEAIFRKINSKKWSKYNQDIYLRFFELITNETDVEVISKAFSALKVFLEKSSKDSKLKWFKTCAKWISGLKIELMQTSCLVLKAFVEIGFYFTHFRGILEDLLSSMSQILTDLKYNQDSMSFDEENSDYDLVIYHLLNLIVEMHKKFKFSQIDEMERISAKILEYFCKFINYSHLWVRQACCDFITSYLLSIGVRKFSEILIKNNNNIWIPSEKCINSIFDSIIELSTYEEISDTTHEKGVKLIILLTQVICNSFKKSDEDSESSHLESIFNKFLKLTNAERLSKMKYKCRFTLLKWISGIMVISHKKSSSKGREKCELNINKKLLHQILSFINREMYTPKVNKELYQIATSVLDIIKKCLPSNTFIDAMNSINDNQNIKSRCRKSKLAIMKTNNPKKLYQSKLKRKITKKAAKSFKNRNQRRSINI